MSTGGNGNKVEGGGASAVEEVGGGGGVVGLDISRSRKIVRDFVDGGVEDFFFGGMIFEAVLK